MTRKLLFLMGLIILVVLGFALLYRSYPTVIPLGPAPARPSPKTVNAPAPLPMTIVLSEQNDSGEMGTAAISEVGGKTVVKLELTGAPAGVTQPAHIHSGSCPTPGAVKYPLTFPVDGASTTTLDVPFSQILGELPLAINVHKSASEAKVYVSCGDITAR